jgi:hypothetical protein
LLKRLIYDSSDERIKNGLISGMYRGISKAIGEGKNPKSISGIDGLSRGFANVSTK